MRRKQTTTPRPSPPRLVGSYPGTGLLSQSKTVKDDFNDSTFLTNYTPQTQWVSENRPRQILLKKC